MTTQHAVSEMEDMIEPLPEWRGDFADDCSLEHLGWHAHCELMGDGLRIKWEEIKKYEKHETWYCAVYFQGVQMYHSGDCGGLFTSGDQVRGICEAVIRAGLKNSSTVTGPTSRNGAGGSGRKKTAAH